MSLHLAGGEVISLWLFEVSAHLIYVSGETVHLGADIVAHL